LSATAPPSAYYLQVFYTSPFYLKRQFSTDLLCQETEEIWLKAKLKFNFRFGGAAKVDVSCYDDISSVRQKRADLLVRGFRGGAGARCRVSCCVLS